MKKINSIFFRSIFILILALHISVSANTIDLDKITKQNSKSHTLLFFHMKYCPYCEAMIDESLKNKDLKEIITNNFNYIDVNISTSGDIKYNDFKGSKHNFAKSLNINFYPTIIFLNNKDTIVYRVKGYRDIEKFTNIIKYISSNSYQTMSLEDYLNSLEMDID